LTFKVEIIAGRAISRKKRLNEARLADFFPNVKPKKLTPSKRYSSNFFEPQFESNFLVHRFSNSSASIIESRHFRKSVNPREKDWIPGQAQNAKQGRAICESLH
jgi:hypothetical protein